MVTRKIGKGGKHEKGGGKGGKAKERGQMKNFRKKKKPRAHL